MSRTLSNFQINEYFSNNKRFGGCYCKDELINKKPGGKFWIINMQDSDDGNGSHWVMVYDAKQGDCGKKRCIYFDSYGISPPEEIKQFMRKSKKPLVYSDAQYQTLDSTNCGYYCIDTINRLEKGQSLETILGPVLDEVNLEQNERRMDKIRLGLPRL